MTRGPSFSAPLRAPTGQPARLASLDAYRGLVMLAMASAGLGFGTVIEKHPEVLARLDGTRFESAWRTAWDWLVYEFDHVPWTGCALWDLIQPSFMFIVGVAVPFSYARRRELGQSHRQMLGHAALRSAVLVALGVFLASNSSRFTMTNFEFTNVLAQIGLGYLVVFLLVGRGIVIQKLVALGILGSYWVLFQQYTFNGSVEELGPASSLQIPAESDALAQGRFAAHWAKHTNAAAAFDRRFLNLFPRREEYRFNTGGYQTLNFVPSIVTMLFGLMAGELLRSSRGAAAKFFLMLAAATALLLTSMALDHTIWPARFWPAPLEEWIASMGSPGGYWSRQWTLCPVVKRIWTPTWTLFSTGWTLLLLAGLYLVIDLGGWRRLAFPLVVVGMNSIVMYLMSQLIKPWVWRTLKIHFGYVVEGIEQSVGRSLINAAYLPIVERVCVLAGLWLVCLWLYDRKIFVRI